MDALISKYSHGWATFSVRSLFIWMLYVAIPLSFFRFYVSRVTDTVDGTTVPLRNAPGIAILFLSLGLISITLIGLFMIWKGQYRSAIAAVLITLFAVCFGYPALDAHYLSPPQGNDRAERNNDAASIAAIACKAFYLRTGEWPKSWTDLESDLSSAVLEVNASRQNEINADPRRIKTPLALGELRDCVDVDFSAEAKALRIQKWMNFTGIVPHRPSYNLYRLQFEQLIDALSSSPQSNK